MIALPQTTTCSSHQTVTERQDHFLVFLPTIRRYARAAFRHLNAEAHDDCVAEIVASAYVAYARLVRLGKAEVAYPTVLARFAIAQFHSGRRVGTRTNTHDVTSRAAQRRHGFIVESLGRVDESTGAWVDAVCDDMATPVPDQAAFRCDFPAWLRTQKPRHRRIAEVLLLGHTTAAVARRFRVSASRISQLRSQFHDSWQAFHDGQPAVGSSA